MIPYVGAQMINALLDYWQHPRVRSSKLRDTLASIKAKPATVSHLTAQNTIHVTLQRLNDLKPWIWSNPSPPQYPSREAQEPHQGTCAG
jgi:hypothetical protein